MVRKFRVFEPGLYASADLQAGKLRYVRQEGGEIKETEETHADGDALAAQAESFVLAVTKNHPVPVDGAEGRRVLKLALEIGRLVRERLARFRMNTDQYGGPGGRIPLAEGRDRRRGRPRVRLRPLRARAGGRGARARDRAVRRRRARRRLQLRHRRALFPAGRRRHRAGRRGGGSGLHLLRHRRGGVLHRRDAGVRRRGRGDVQPRSRARSRKRITQEDQGGHRGPPVRPVRGPGRASPKSARRKS